MKERKGANLKIIAHLGIFSLLALLCLHLETQASSGNSEFDQTIKKIAQEHGLEPALIHSIIRAESNYNCNAISSKGAMGLMQLMPETAKKYGVRNPFDPAENIEGGVKYLKDLMNIFGRRTDYVLAAYNAGQEALKRNGGIPPYPETKNYIEKVMASYRETYIGKKTEIFKYRDESGTVVLTNCRYLYSLNKEREKAN